MIWEPLATDLLLYLLLAGMIAYAIHVARDARLREAWRSVFSRPMGAITGVILLAFLLVTVLDSIHYKPIVTATDGNRHASAQVISVFDALVTPLRVDTEESYSAPFATHLYGKQMLPGVNGKTVFAYPRLKYGGASLAPGQSRGMDILQRSLDGAAWGGGITAGLLILGILVAALRSRAPPGRLLRRLATGHTRLAWRSMLGTVLALAIVTGMLVTLSAGYHVFGTDKIGRDVLYITLKSIRTGVLIGTLTTLIMLPFALLLGPMAGYFRGWVDDVIQYIYTTLSSIPGVLLIVAAMLMLQLYVQQHADIFDSAASRADIRLLFLCVILGITSWSGLCRVLRAETLKIAQIDYVQAAKALGVGNLRIILRHVLPNVMHLVLIQIVLDFSALVLAEAVLSYIGIGVDPSSFSWGNMINSARLELAREPIVWWPLAAAFVFMLTLVLSANLFSDTVRDAFDPHLHYAPAST